jgi:hypothetical protein
LVVAAAAQHGWTALMWAAEDGHADCARLLLDAGADKDAKDVVRASVICVRSNLLESDSSDWCCSWWFFSHVMRIGRISDIGSQHRLGLCRFFKHFLFTNNFLILNVTDVYASHS